MFTFGANYGFWRGALQAAKIPFFEVMPKQWQKGLVSPKIKGADRKRALLQLAKERYPKIKVTLATADALLMLAVFDQLAGSRSWLDAEVALALQSQHNKPTTGAKS
jgi:hypothetical protein